MTEASRSGLRFLRLAVSLSNHIFFVLIVPLAVVTVWCCCF
jgi:hypothetical protein